MGGVCTRAGLGGLPPFQPAAYSVFLGNILLYTQPLCKPFFALFRVLKVTLLCCGKLVARHGRDMGSCRNRVQGGAKGFVRAVAIPRRWAGKPWDTGPVGIAGAWMPCGAWDGDEGTGAVLWRA